METNDIIYCPTCQNSIDIDLDVANLSILCGKCKFWFHGKCIGLCVEEVESYASAVSSWTCPSCETLPSSQNISLLEGDLLTCSLCPPNTGKLFKGKRGLRIHCTRAHSNTSLPSSDSTISPDTFNSQLVSCKKDILVLRRIPKGARYFAAEKLAQVIDNCMSQNTIESWHSLLSFAYIAFRVPANSSRFGKFNRPTTSLVSTIKNNLKNFTLLPSSSRKNYTYSKDRLVEAKIADGDVRGAVRILSSEFGVATYSGSCFNALLEKHPSPSRPLLFPDPPTSDSQPLSVSVDLVSQAIHSFPNGSSSGIDGLRPQHLNDLISTSAGDAGQRLLNIITKFCNFILNGKINADICPIFYGASLIALNKKDGGLRPIAIGNVFRRLVAKLACSSVRSDLGVHLRPYQLGFGSSRGCESVIHSVRSFLHLNSGSDKVLLKLDFRNAFNCIERDTLLAAVKEQLPSLYPFLWQAYKNPSNLYHGSNIISSQRGVQQGDPTGPMLFSLATFPIIQKCSSSLNMFYLDDGTLCDEPHQVLADLQKLIVDCRSVGLELNPDKCELYFLSDKDEAVASAFQKLAPGIKVISNSELIILGSPIMLQAIEPSLSSKVQELKNTLNGLTSLKSHIGYFLLKNCLAIPKLMYFMRTTPLWMFPSLLLESDNLLRTCLKSILNLHLDDKNWTLASLPISIGGLGIRKLSDVCLPAFLASCHGVSEFIKSTFSIYGDNFEVCFLSEAIQEWSVLRNLPAPPAHFEVQKNWDSISAKRTHQSLLASSTSDVDKARYLAIQEKEASSWLKALPSANIGTLMDDSTFKVAIALRLGCKLCQPHSCVCGSTVDTYGHHALSCIKSPGRFSRHFMINDIIKRALVSAGIPSILEPTGLSRSDGRRPDGLTLIPWTNGKSLLWDATCVDTVAPSHVPNTSLIAGSAAESAVVLKRNKYKSLLESYVFVAFAVETFGSWSWDAKKIVREIGHKIQSCNGDRRSTAYLQQRISIAIQRGNAASFMGTFPASSSLEEIFYI